MRGCQIGRSPEEMSVSGLAGTRLARENGSERAGGLVSGFVGVAATCEALQCGLDGTEVVERVEAVGAAAEFSGGLGAAEHQKAKNGGLIATEIEDGADSVLIFGNAGVVNSSDEGEVFKGVERLPDLPFGEIEDGIATGTLVACVE
jgi:hypothetical protein